MAAEPELEALHAHGLEPGVIERARERGTLSDLALAVASLADDAAAQRRLDALIERACRDTAARMNVEPWQSAEIAQQLRTRLLVAGPRRGPALATYDGRGPLLAWLRVCASRQILMARRSPQHPTAPAEIAAAALDPELDLIRADSAAGIKAAFEAAFAELSPGDRMLLAYHHVDQRSLTEIGRIVGVHASTVLRRLDRVRERLLTQVRARFAEQVQASEAELDRVVGLVGSQLDLSISRILGRAGRDG